jgi:nitroreductase
VTIETLPAALASILVRHSVGPKHLRDPAPDDAALELAARAALRAPDHGKLVPFRFAVVRGAARERLADLFEDYGRRRGKSAGDVAAERDRAAGPPVVVAVVTRIDAANPDVPPHEQWACAGGAVANFLNALHALGYAGKMLSGARAADPVIAAAFCGPGEALLGWIAAGTADAPPKGRGVDEPRSVLGSWVPAADR